MGARGRAGKAGARYRLMRHMGSARALHESAPPPRLPSVDLAAPDEQSGLSAMQCVDASVCTAVPATSGTECGDARTSMQKIADEFYLLGALAGTGSGARSPPLSKNPPAPPPSQPTASSTKNVHRLRQLLAPATPSAEKEVPDGADFLVWDTETSGIGSGDVVVQLAWAVCSESGEVLRRYDRLWKLPPHRKIGWGAYKVHGISAKRVAARGYMAAAELRAFVALVCAMRKRRLRVVAHNAAFDVRMLKQTARAHAVDDAIVDAFEKQDFFCTMAAARDNCGLRNRAGRKRNPSNAELYERLIGKPPEGRLHDAFADIMVTAASYAAGKRRRWW